MITGKFKKDYEDSTVIIYKNDFTGMCIEYLKDKNFYIVLDYFQDNKPSFVWEFPTYSEALICAKDWYLSNKKENYI
jgi:hypothetical protein